MKAWIALLVSVFGFQIASASLIGDRDVRIFSVAGPNQNYFDQFLYQITGSCEDIKTVWFYAAGSWKEFDLGFENNDSEGGRPMVARLHLQLFKDGTYWVRYSESVIVESTPSQTRYETKFQTVKEGQWQVDQEKIVLEGLGVGVPTKIKLNSGYVADGIAFALTQLLNDPRALGKTTLIGKMGTNNGPRGKSIREFCGLPL